MIGGWSLGGGVGGGWGVEVGGREWGVEGGGGAGARGGGSFRARQVRLGFGGGRCGKV